MSAGLPKFQTTYWSATLRAVALAARRTASRLARQGSSWQRTLKTRCGQAITASLIVHSFLVVWAALVAGNVSDEFSRPILDSQWSVPATELVEAPIEIVPLAAPEPVPTPGGSKGLWLSAMAIDPVIAAPNLTASNSQTAPPTKNAAAGGLGNGRGIGNADGNGREFFGLKSDARRIVYVLDCSLSMRHPHDSDAKTRFRRVQQELMQSVSRLKPEQEFFIVFFNHETWPMPIDRPVLALPDNQRRFLSWAQQMEPTGDTDPTGALRLALRLQPDVIYLLTDGAFSPAANDIVRSIRQHRTTIHTFNFATALTDKQREGAELIRQHKASVALRKLGERTFRQLRELVMGELVLRDLAARNGGEFHVIP